MTFEQLQARLGRQLNPADWSQTAHGGWIEKTTHVGPMAAVSDDAVVRGYACVYGHAKISDSADVSGYSCVFDNARVFGNAQVFGQARVFDSARVFGNAKIDGFAEIHGRAAVKGSAEISGRAHIQKGVLDTGVWVDGDISHTLRVRKNLAAELQADLEESARRLVL